MQRSYNPIIKQGRETNMLSFLASVCGKLQTAETASWQPRPIGPAFWNKVANLTTSLLIYLQYRVLYNLPLMDHCAYFPVQVPCMRIYTLLCTYTTYLYICIRWETLCKMHPSTVPAGAQAPFTSRNNLFFGLIGELYDSWVSQFHAREGRAMCLARESCQCPKSLRELRTIEVDEYPCPWTWTIPHEFHLLHV